MSYVALEGTSEVQKILCCQCGVPIAPNPANTCVACIRTQVDITADIPKQMVIYFCRFCERYLQPPSFWVVCSLESRELMALCLKRLKNLSKVKLIDAIFVWTEPHSKRIKVKLTIQGEVMAGTILQQSFVVEYIVNHQMCDDCRRVEAKDTWNASVQVRQKTSQRKTLYFLEQILLKYDATKDCVGVQGNHDGMDFFFGFEPYARKLTDFLQTMVPMRFNTSKKLISHDGKSNTYNYKYVFSVEVVPICKDNIVCLPTKLAKSLGSIGQICHVNKVTSVLHLIDPQTGQVADLSATTFFKQPFKSLVLPKHLVEYTVMNIEPISENDRHRFSGQGTISKRHVLADCWVVKSSELGMNDDTIHCRTHLGHLLSPGDTVMGFDLKNSNVNDENLDKMAADKIPDVVLVKKVYAEKALRNRKRKWKLKFLNEELHREKGSVTSQGGDFGDFLDDMEEDPELRKHVNVYKDSKKMAVDTESEIGEGEAIPQITLAEMLDDLNIESMDSEAQVVDEYGQVLVE